MQRLEIKDISVYVLLAILYAVIYIPRALQEFPSDYRQGVQENMAYVAKSIARGSNPYTPPYPDFYSTGGGHLHGVAGAPFELLINSPAAPRFGVLLMGFISLLIFYSILRNINVRRLLATGMTVLLSIYPQFVLFHTIGISSAADLFFGLIAVSTYLQWRSEQAGWWLMASSIASGAAVFSHFYSGVVAIGLLAHYTLSTEHGWRTRARTAVVYGAGMIPAGALLIVYKVIFSQSDPASHYFDRLIFNSFDSLYATERIYGASFSVFSTDFIDRVMIQHGDKAPIFGHWLLLVLVGIALILGWQMTPTDQHNHRLFVFTWIVAGSLTGILIPGGVLYHAYYTWWLLPGVFAGIGWSFEALLLRFNEDRALIILFFPALLTGCLLWFSLTSPWTALVS